MPSRRNFITVAALALSHLLRATQTRFRHLPPALSRIEQTNGGRLGVAILDTVTGERSGYRAEERFPMCSTFKFLLASAVLQRVDQRKETLDRAVPVPPRPLIFNSPLTEQHAGGAMTISDLCYASLTRSDNTAANLLLEIIGGPAGITSFSRSIGDRTTRLDRTEIALNESLAGDPRDTTTPLAMANDLKHVLLGKVLSPASIKRLTSWMESATSGLNRLRANLPTGWRAIDKTGSNGEHTSNDIAMFWPPSGAPVAVTAYITQCPGSESKRAAVLQEIGLLVREAMT
jgi:beta-lactamase class A